jgi:hypothetical protein
MRYLCLISTILLLTFTSSCRQETAESTSTTPAAAPEKTTEETTLPMGDDLTYVPGERFGKITGFSEEGDFKFLYGERIVPAEIPIGEGFTTSGYRLFPGTRNEVDIILPNEENGVEQLIVKIRNQDSQWRTPGRSLAIGTSLKDLEKLNGKPITFLGFEWDYGGRVLSWNNGELEGIGATLSTPPSSNDSSLPEALIGDHEISSDDPVLEGNQIWVAEISVPLTPPEYNEDGVPATTDFNIVPGYRFGALTASVQAEDLRLIYGASNVEPMDYELPGGVTVAGYRLFSGTKNEVEIGLPDEDGYLEGMEFRISKDGSDWHLAGTDVRVGDRLTEVRHVNGRAFNIYAHNMEGGGQVNSWEGGELSGTGLEFDTSTHGKNYQYDEEMEVSSDTDAVKKSDPKVSVITIFLQK